MTEPWEHAPDAAGEGDRPDLATEDGMAAVFFTLTI